MKPILLAASLLFSLLPAAAQAQTASRWSGGVDVGAARTWDDESFIGTGLLTGARIGFDLTDRTTAEVSVTGLPHHRRFEQSPVEVDGRSIVTGLTLKHDFRRAGLRPYVLAGYGVNQHSRTWIESDASSRSYSAWTHGYNAGLGFAVRRSRWEHGVESRLYMLAIEEDTGAAVIITGAYRAGIRF